MGAAFFRPLRRGAYRPWALTLHPDFEARGLASGLIGQHFSVFALDHQYANDRDHIRW
jgi:hypothetical protein